MDASSMHRQQQLQRQMQQQQQQQQEERLKAVEEQRRVAMRSLLSSEAQQRLARIHLVKPEKAVAAENFILQATRSGTLQPPVSEASLIQVLESISGSASGTASAAPKVVVSYCMHLEAAVYRQLRLGTHKKLHDGCETFLQIRRRRFDDSDDDF